MAVLHAVKGPLQGQAFKIPDDRERVVVGRFEDRDLVIPDPGISRKHFVIERRADGAYLVDLGSLNGTLLNGDRISTAKLAHGDRIRVGQTELSYDETDSAVPPEAPSPEPDAERIEEALPDLVSGSDIDILAEGEPTSLTWPNLGESEKAEPVSETGPDVEKVEEAEPVPVTGSDNEEIEEAEPVSEDDIISTPRSERAPGSVSRFSAQTLALAIASHPEKKSPPAEEPPEAAPAAEDKGRCAMCGREVPSEEIDSGEGEGERTSDGYVCGNCAEKRKKSGKKRARDKTAKKKRRRVRKRR